LGGLDHSNRQKVVAVWRDHSERTLRITLRTDSMSHFSKTKEPYLLSSKPPEQESRCKSKSGYIYKMVVDEGGHM
jgi:hypothetical protein